MLTLIDWGKIEFIVKGKIIENFEVKCYFVLI